MTQILTQILRRLDNAARVPDEIATSLLDCDPGALIARAAAQRDAGHGERISYSRKVFLPLTQLCRDVCHYCTFAHAPRPGTPAYLSEAEIRETLRRGQAAGAKEALFTLGDKPELRYAAAREALAERGFATTIDCLVAMAQLVLTDSGLLPHVNPGLLTAEELARLRRVSVSQGVMLESISARLLQKGGAHYGSPDKDPAARLEMIAEAGRQKIPFTTGLLIGIGETPAERIEALLALRRLHERHGHLQEIIIQTFRAKPGTRMAEAAEPDLATLCQTIAITRLIFGPQMNIQAPPNLSPGVLPALIAAGINDWGGVSPVTPDFVNPEASWPHLTDLEQQTAAAGKHLVERLAIYPAYALAPDTWLDAGLRAPVLRAIDADGFARTDPWKPGAVVPPPSIIRHGPPPAPALRSILAKAIDGVRLDEADIVRLFAADGHAFDLVCATADQLRHQMVGDIVTYVVNRNINYTNICFYRCGFCAFSKGRTAEQLRGRPYDISLEEIARRAEEAWTRGATEVCLQGGIHPRYTGQTYLDICRAVKAAVPGMHIHAFSPLEVTHGAATLGLSVPTFLARLQAAGLGTLPGTAAEILDDEVRRIICPDKLDTQSWLDVIGAAHALGLPTTSTIMFGHVERPVHWARHLLRLRDLQARTGGLTEFVPLPFVAEEAPLYRKGKTRTGPTWREAVLMHAVARLALHPLVTNIQTSWVKMGDEVAACLRAGANDIGGTLMNESITRAAGGQHGEEFAPAEIETLVQRLGRQPRQRSTLYGAPDGNQTARSFHAPALNPVLTMGAAM